NKAAGVWLVTADRVAKRPQSLLDGLRHHTDTACAVAISEHELRSRSLISMAGRRRHRMAIDQHGGAEFPMQAGKEPAQGAGIRVVEAFNALQGIIDRYALVIDFLRITNHACHRSQAARDTHRTRIGERRQPAVEHTWIELIGLAVHVDKAAREMRAHHWKACVDHAGDQFIDEAVFRAAQGGDVEAAIGQEVARIDLAAVGRTEKYLPTPAAR